MNKINRLYLATLPERTIRSIISGFTGLTSLMTTLLLPDVVKDSSTYRVTFGMLQQFLIEKVAEIEPHEAKQPLKNKYLLRKTAGSIIEADRDYNTIYELLDAIYSSSLLGVNTIDTPPISLEEFNLLKTDLTAQFSQNNTATMKISFS